MPLSLFAPLLTTALLAAAPQPAPPILRAQAGLDRRTAVVGAVGASWELGKGINPGVLAR